MEHPDDVAQVRSEFAKLQHGVPTLGFESRFRAKDGSYRNFSWTAVPDNGLIYCVARDVTEQRAHARALADAEAALRQAQKMETLGQLTGGVAHDFNNLLQIVTGNLELLQRGLKEEDRLRRTADNAMAGAQRAAMLTQRLLAFSRRQPLAPVRVDPNRLVSNMSDLLNRTLGETIEVETIQTARAWPVEIDINQMEDALLSLAANARDAMPGGGKLTIEVANTHIDDHYAAQDEEVLPGQYVLICMSDTGQGMDPVTLSHAIEPFFTTKEVGRGTGLGLSMVYGFIKQSGGHFRVYSEVGQGTSVKIYLPRHHGPAPANDRLEETPRTHSGGGHETVLVCEDDDKVRAYAVEVLSELGYRVVEASSGPAALDALDCAAPPDHAPARAGRERSR
jgi:signal transduction histidine kinase